MRRSGATIILCALLAACSAGSAHRRQLPSVRLDYNEAIARSSNEQLLLNLVRLRYLHAPQFFEVTSVTTQSAVVTGGRLSLETNLGNNLTDGSIFTPFFTGGLGGTIQLEDRPTVQYGPLAGEQFARRMVTPIRPDTILLMVQVGWRIDRLLGCCVQRANDLTAPVIASRDPRFGGAGFLRLGELLHELQVRDALEVDVIGKGPELELVLSLVPIEGDERARHLVAEVQALLGLDPSRRSYRVVSSFARLDAAPAPEGSDRIVLRGRSLLGALFYLSHGVETAKESPGARALGYTGRDGQAVEVPNPVPEPLLRVSSSEVPFEGAYTRVDYRGRTYAVEDGDLESKQVFLLLQVLFGVLSSDRPGPLLTIPVGG